MCIKDDEGFRSLKEIKVLLGDGFGKELGKYICDFVCRHAEPERFVKDYTKQQIANNIVRWYHSLFAPYMDEHFIFLKKVGIKYMNLNIPGFYIKCMFMHLREKINSQLSQKNAPSHYFIVLNKFLDININIISEGYAEAFIKDKNNRKGTTLLYGISTTDFLTGLYNRRYLENILKTVFPKIRRYREEAVFIMIDIDHFKQVNDTYGHLFGDFVLKESAKIIALSIKGSDIVARFGGEEFFIGLFNCNLPDGIRCAERLRKKIEKHTFTKDDISVKITVSMGISCFPFSGIRDVSDIFELTDIALYEAKNSGRNKVCICPGTTFVKEK